MNRITAFTDVEFDEHRRMSRRVQRGFPELSVEERAWLEYQRDPQGTTDRLDLADNAGWRNKELPIWVQYALIWFLVASLIGVVGVSMGLAWDELQGRKGRYFINGIEVSDEEWEAAKEEQRAEKRLQ